MSVFAGEIRKIYDPSYTDTAVYASKNPFCFVGDPVGHIPSHASEILKINGDYYITHCGWGQDGVYIAPLFFDWKVT